MADDSVREELARKIKTVPRPKKTSIRRENYTVQKPSSPFKLNPPPSPIITQAKVETATAEISSKKTNRTLVEFQSKDGTLPEWRTQLRNAVRQRQLQQTPDVAGAETTTAAAFSAPNSDEEFFAGNEIITETGEHDELLSSALKRIESSRKKFHIVDTKHAPVVARQNGTAAATKLKAETIQIPQPAIAVKPQTISPNVDLYDTSELDPNFVPAKVSSSFGKVKIKTSAAPEAPEVGVSESVVATKESEMTSAAVVDDRAPFGYRFNAGLFDILTASFVSLILLAPFMLLGGDWFTIAGLFAFLATCSIVNFIYLTATIGLFGKSFGMHLFSLEMIDAQGVEYPSLHQAAVSSSIFLLSLAFGGAGFVTCLLDEDGRAIHDLLSNTIVVRELS